MAQGDLEARGPGFGSGSSTYCGAVVKNPRADAGDAREADPIPGWGKSPGGGNGNPLQYSYLGNPMDRGAQQATVHGVTKSQTQPSD